MCRGVHERDEIRGTRVTDRKEAGEQVALIRDGSGAETASATTQRRTVFEDGVAGVARDLPVVGRWRSADETILYVAVGGTLTPEPLPKRKS